VKVEQGRVEQGWWSREGGAGRVEQGGWSRDREGEAGRVEQGGCYFKDE
jgi:hypothetical protein